MHGRGQPREAGASWQKVSNASGANPAENYHKFFVPSIGAPLAHDLVNSAKLQPGERVLDLACGTGVVAQLAAIAVGASGNTTGLDVNPMMLEVARTVTPPSDRIEWVEGNAEAIPLPNEAFDVVLCQMALQFVDDKPSALREMRRVLAKDGRMVMNLPGPAPEMFEMMGDALARHFGPEAATFVGAVFSLYDPDEVAPLLERAGFRDIEVLRETKMLKLPPPREFLWQYILSTPLALGVGEADADTRNALEGDVVRGWNRFSSNGGMEMKLSMTTALARK